MSLEKLGGWKITIPLALLAMLGGTKGEIFNVLSSPSTNNASERGVYDGGHPAASLNLDYGFTQAAFGKSSPPEGTITIQFPSAGNTRNERKGNSAVATLWYGRPASRGTTERYTEFPGNKDQVAMRPPRPADITDVPYLGKTIEQDPSTINPDTEQLPRTGSSIKSAERGTGNGNS